MNTKSTLILQIMHVVFWVIFIGTCIQAGAVLVSFLVSVLVNQQAASDLYLGLDLAGTLAAGTRYYYIAVGCVLSLLVMKAILFYYIIRLSTVFKLTAPFSEPVNRMITRISEVALVIGLTGIMSVEYARWLMKRNVDIGEFLSYTDMGKEYLFMAGIVFVIGQVFRRGLELQSENDYTV